MTHSSFTDVEDSKSGTPRKLKRQPEAADKNRAPSAPVEAVRHEIVSILPFQAEAALDRVKGDRELLRQMAGLFAKQWNDLWVEILVASQRQDVATLQIVANRLRRSLESFAAGEASRAAQELETLGSKCDFRNVHKTCARLKSAIDRLVTALTDFANAAAAPK
jgi:hypothetical protein